MTLLTASTGATDGPAARTLSFFGLPSPLDWLARVDGDPDQMHAKIDHLTDATHQLAEAGRVLADRAGACSGRVRRSWTSVRCSTPWSR